MNKKVYGGVVAGLLAALTAVALLLGVISPTGALNPLASRGEVPENGQASVSPPVHKDPVELKTTTRASSFKRGSKQSYSDGIQVEVARIQRSKLGEGRIGRHVKEGAPIQLLTVRVRNGTNQELDLGGSLTTMTYGEDYRQKANRVYGKGISGLSGRLPPARSKTGTIGFAVPKKHLYHVMLKLTIDSSHVPAIFVGSLDYSPGFSTVFNDPMGSYAEQYRIIEHINRSIGATPPGATIRIAQYAFDITSSAKKLMAAHRRGVHVQMLIDHHKPWGALPWEDRVVTKQTRRLIRVLGTNKKKKSFVTMCKASCMSSRTSAMHAKFYLFSEVGSSRWVSMVGSANITETNSKLSWNNNQTIVGDRTIYDSLTKYFRDMIKDKNNPNYYRTTTSGRYKLYFYPRKEEPGTRAVALLDVLDHTSCTGAAKGYGAKDGRTVIQLAMYSWSSSRLDIAEQLWRLHNRGCQVHVILNAGGGRLSRSVRHALLTPSKKYGKIQLYNAWVDHNGNGRANQYMHHKTLLVNGVWFGRRNTKVTYAGSQNFSGNATRDNNELILRIQDDAVHDAHADNFKNLQSRLPPVQW